MINALPAAWTVRGLTLLVIALCGAMLYRSSPTEAGRLFAAQGLIVMAVNILILALTIRPVFKFCHRWTWAHWWWFPLLDGEWEGKLWSNWSRVEAMMAAARRDTGPFDTLTQDLPPGAEAPIKVTATIRSSLFEIEMILRVPDAQRVSKTLFVRPQWRRPLAPCITYVYEQIDHAPILVTDTPKHRGAALLEYDKEADELCGEYWTERQAAKGLNTAGTLILKRLPRAPPAEHPLHR